MRAHYLQHALFEDLGTIKPWLLNAGYMISSTQFFNFDKLPEIKNIDMLVVMGGPMSVNDEFKYPWLVTEKEFIRSAVKAGKPILGICLGAQLIANALGGKVFPNKEKEIGWLPVESVNSKSKSTFQLPEKTEVFHWHSDTFSLPIDGVQIAKSKGCKNQAFQIGSNVIGLQFHSETTPMSALAIVENCRDELVDGPYGQSEAEILSVPKEQYISINNIMERVLTYLHKSNCLT